jgi:hypothetical protein
MLESLHSRRSVIKHGAAALGALALPLLPRRAARAQSVTFDYYISPTGSDSNPGTQAEPWAITAINTKQSVYGGKRVGLLDGTYPMYSMVNGGSYTRAALLVNGGTSPSPTVIAAVNPRMAILDAHSTPGTTGSGYPTGTQAVIGIGPSDAPPVKGYFTLDGLVITGSNTIGVTVTGVGGIAGSQQVPTGQKYAGGYYGGIPEVTIQNCEIYDIYSTNYGNNPGAVKMSYTTGLKLINNKIHPMLTSSSPLVTGFVSFNCYQNEYTYNSFYSMDCIEEKEGPQGGTLLAYNYIEGFNQSLSTIRDFCGGALGWTNTFHHNIIVGFETFDMADSTNPSQFSQESIVSYNNTFYYGGGIFSTAGFDCKVWGSNGSTSPAARLTHYNNIYYCTGSGLTGSDVIFTLDTGTIANSDYNCFRPNAATYNLLYSQPAGSTALTGHTLAGWQSVSGMDTHSIANNPRLANPVTARSGGTPVPAGFQLSGTYGNGGSSPCAGAGRVGGTSGGATCNMGAWDGTVTQIGCDFASNGAADASSATPRAPILSIT